ncbi:MAG: hypothetical protein ACOCXG_04930 [Nanoarchaeota archaeon]
MEYILWVKIISNLVILIATFLIGKRVRKLYKISDYEGFKIFSFAFFAFFIAFIFDFIIFYLRDYVLGVFEFSEILNTFYEISIFLFLTFLVFGGFLLIYSLVWKSHKKDKFPRKIFLFLVSLIIAYFSLENYSIAFVTMIVLFAYGINLTFTNYKRSKSNYSQFYFYAISLGFLGFLANFLLGFFTGIKFYIYAINTMIFVMIYYVTLKLKKK